MRKLEGRNQILSAVLGALLLAATGWASAPPAAIDSFGPGGLNLQPTVPWERAFLIVSGPGGQRIEQTFEAGAAIGFSGLDRNGALLPDGDYLYELRLASTTSVIGEDAKAAMAATPEGREAARSLVRVAVGTFRMENGGLDRAEKGPGAGATGPRPELGVDPAKGEGPIERRDFTDPGDIMAGSGMAAGSTAASPSIGELELHFGGVSSVERFGAELVLEAVDDGFGNTGFVTITDSGNVGIGTFTPGEELHSFDTFINDFRMENLFSGIHSQWSLSADEARFQIEDEENGVTPFRIDFAAASSMLRLNSNGNVGIYESSPQARLHVTKSPQGGNAAIVEGGAMAVQRFDGISANIRFETNTAQWLFQNQPTDNSFNIRDATNSNTPFRIFPSAGGATFVIRNSRIGLGVVNPAFPIDSNTGARLSAGGQWLNASSREYKRDIEPLSAADAGAALDRLEPVTFTYKVEGEDQHVGFIAEDVPDLVATSDRKTLGSMDLVAVLARVVQEQRAQVQEQQNQIDELRRVVEALQAER